MIRSVSHRRPICRNLVLLIGACLAVGALGGCCTVRCCKSQKCADVTRCAAAGEHTLVLVKSRLDGCPDLWMRQMVVRPGDVVKIVNCSGQKAIVTFTPPDFLVEGGKFDIENNQTLRVTVSPDVSLDDVVSIVVEGGNGCSHGGGQLIVGDGP